MPDPKVMPAKPQSAEVEAEAAIEIRLLKEENRALRAKIDAYAAADAARREAEAKARANAPSGTKLPFALMSIYGSREYTAGDQLAPSDTAGLKEGVHYDMRTVTI